MVWCSHAVRSRDPGDALMVKGSAANLDEVETTADKEKGPRPSGDRSMSVSEPRPSPAASVRPGNILVWGIIVFLGLVFAGLTWYQILSRDRNQDDAEKLRALAPASARQAPPRP